jgi:hypothetical protein
VVGIDGAMMNSGEVFDLLGRIERKREIEAELGFRVAAATLYWPQRRRHGSRRTASDEVPTPSSFPDRRLKTMPLPAGPTGQTHTETVWSAGLGAGPVWWASAR